MLFSSCIKEILKSLDFRVLKVDVRKACSCDYLSVVNHCGILAARLDTHSTVVAKCGAIFLSARNGYMRFFFLHQRAACAN